jgi:hypothetical protein
MLWSRPVSRLNATAFRKETTMLYKTIILELLRQRPKIYDELRQKRILLPTMEFYAKQLKTRHEAWVQQLSQSKLDSNQNQVASAALEIALADLESALNSPNDSEPISVFTQPPTTPTKQ